MVRSLLLWAGILAMAALQFRFFPGHTYLASRTQLYVPMLERLDAPGDLSRDLVATNPQLSYTVYDEVTLFLHNAVGLPFETVLQEQQIVFRIAALFGIFLLSALHWLGTALRVSLNGAGEFRKHPAGRCSLPYRPRACAKRLCVRGHAAGYGLPHTWQAALERPHRRNWPSL